MFQIRKVVPRAGVRDPYYSPERDVATCGPFVIATALHLLPELIASDEIFATLSLHTTEEKTEDAAYKLGKALTQIIDSEVTDAFKEAGFLDADPYARGLIYAAIGKSFLASVWSGVKDVHKPGDTPPMSILDLVEELTALTGKV